MRLGVGSQHDKVNRGGLERLKIFGRDQHDVLATIASDVDALVRPVDLIRGASDVRGNGRADDLQAVPGADLAPTRNLFLD